MSGQHCESYDVKRETVHCYPVHCWPLLHVMAGISVRFSNFAFVLFCYITNHLMTGPLGNSEFCLPRISMFPSTSSRETLRFSGNKIYCSPRDQSLSVYSDIVVGLALLVWFILSAMFVEAVFDLLTFCTTSVMISVTRNVIVVCSLYLHFVPGLQSAVCILYWPIVKHALGIKNVLHLFS